MRSKPPRLTSALSGLFAIVITAFLFQPVRAQATVFRVVLLGTGSPTPSLDRLGPSILVEAGAEMLIFDVGRSVFVRLNQLGIAFRDLSGILFTHLHSDHVSGLPDLWLTGRFAGRPPERNLDVWGPSGTKSMVANLALAYQFDLTARQHLPPTQGALVAHDISEGPVFNATALPSPRSPSITAMWRLRSAIASITADAAWSYRATRGSARI